MIARRPAFLVAALAGALLLSLEGRAQDPRPAFVSPSAVAEALRVDVLAREKADRPFTRWFTLAHLANAGAKEDSLALHASSLSKLVNALSWKEKAVVPAAVDARKTLLRIDLRDYGWDAKTWETLVQACPVALVPATAAAKECAAETGSDVPWLRADWFLASASRSPLYSRILALPDTESELEKLVGVDVAANIASRKAKRAGFHASGESDGNRIIERHPLRLGSYWKTYDFRDGDLERNVFARPLGPGMADDPYEFKHDGSEVFFTLPNGLLAYAIFDEKGAREDEAPLGVVWNKEAGAGSIRTQAALTCMGCHSRGPRIDHFDQMRRWFVWHADLDKNLFPERVLSGVRDLYPEKLAWDTLQDDDRKAFRRAVESAGSSLEEDDPVAVLAARYDAPVDRRAAASELGLEESAFSEKLARSPVPGLGALADGKGRLARAAFSRAFSVAAEAWELGKHGKAEPAPSDESHPPAGCERFFVPLGDGTLSIDVESCWKKERRRTGLLFLDGARTIELWFAPVRMKDLDTVLEGEKLSLAERFVESSTGDHPQLGRVLTVRSLGESLGTKRLDALALVQGRLFRLAARSPDDKAEETKAELEKILASVSLTPGAVSSGPSPLPKKLEEAGFETDWNKAIARSKAEGKLIVLFIKPAPWWYT